MATMIVKLVYAVVAENLDAPGLPPRYNWVMADKLRDHLDHYAHGREHARLSDGRGILERDRTKSLVARVLPPPPATVYDVGGGPGVYARWLADLGYDVTLIDPYPLHVEQAAAEAARGVAFTVLEGDARSLPAEDGSVDVVLLFGPLYHLIERSDRLLALAEARRVLRSGGLLAAAAITRHASLLESVSLGRLEDPECLRVVDRAVATGHHEPGIRDGFTRAYFHRPEELRDEVDAAGFADVDLLGVEGPACLLPELIKREAPPAPWMFAAAELCERDPLMIGMSAHLLALARVPSDR
jgi:SAM-dependent methyltransferase